MQNHTQANAAGPVWWLVNIGSGDGLVASEWVSELSNWTAFLGTADSEVHIVHISRVITAYRLESLFSLT